jgi:hypothetical protein
MQSMYPFELETLNGALTPEECAQRYKTQAHRKELEL